MASKATPSPQSTVQATAAQRVLEFISKYRGHVEGQQGQQHRDFVLDELGRREVWSDGLVELAQAILERAPLR